MTSVTCLFCFNKNVLWQIFVVVLVLFCLQFMNYVSALEDEKVKIGKKQADDPFLPSMIVFNLDHTLWPFAMEIMQPPFNHTSEKCQIKDKVGRLFNLFPDVYDILQELDSKWYKLAGLSDNSDIRRVEETADLFNIDKFFNAFEAKPGNKTEQMLRLSERAKVPLENILYYDSNKLDLDDMKAMNVTGVWLNPRGGLTYAHVEQGFQVFRDYKCNTTAATTGKP